MRWSVPGFPRHASEAHIKLFNTLAEWQNPGYQEPNVSRHAAAAFAVSCGRLYFLWLAREEERKGASP